MQIDVHSLLPPLSVHFDVHAVRRGPKPDPNPLLFRRPERIAWCTPVAPADVLPAEVALRPQGRARGPKACVRRRTPKSRLCCTSSGKNNGHPKHSKTPESSSALVERWNVTKDVSCQGNRQVTH